MSTVLITGCSKGIGRATALELARRGHRVVATARDAATLADLPVEARLPLDVTDDDSVQAAVRAATELVGPVDALVSNAGEVVFAPVESTPLPELTRLLQLNTVGALRVTQALLPGMRERGRGRLLYLSSVAGRVGVPLGSAYAASKWALEAIAETLAAEAAPFGVAVTLLEPGPVSSGALDNPTVYLTPDDPYADVAAAASFDPSTYITVDEVAGAIADCLEDVAPPLRLPVGAFARHALAGRAG